MSDCRLLPPGYGEHIMDRFSNQFRRMANSNMTPWQDMQVMGQDSHIFDQLGSDLWKDDGGPLTKHQRHHLNHELNHTSHDIYDYKHPDRFHELPVDPETPMIPFGVNPSGPEQPYC